VGAVHCAEEVDLEVPPPLGRVRLDERLHHELLGAGVPGIVHQDVDAAGHVDRLGDGRVVRHVERCRLGASSFGFDLGDNGVRTLRDVVVHDGRPSRRRDGVADAPAGALAGTGDEHASIREIDAEGHGIASGLWDRPSARERSTF
jgi:hypothetical protein